MISFNLPEYVKTALERLSSKGFEAYCVGGCVRDSYMNIPPHDYDITTSAMPAETLECFNDYHCIETGVKHGTVTVMIDHQPLEITTFRIDGEYSDNRHPDKVEFTRTLKEDLSRRDFTMNALAYNGELIDMFGGCKDIDNGIIRTVGEADKRFSEDALRIMRAIRFSSVLGFEIEENTKKSIFKNKDLLKSISAERLFDELSKLLLGDNVFKALMDYKEVIAVFLPQLQPCFTCEQNNPHHIYNVWEHTAKSVENAPKDAVIRLSLLFHDAGKPMCKTRGCDMTDHFYAHAAISAELAEKALNSLKVSNEIKRRVLRNVEFHEIRFGTKEKSVRKLLAKVGAEGFFELMQIKKADFMAQNPLTLDMKLQQIEFYEETAKRLLAENAAISIKDLAIDGNDLIALGFEGKEIGKLLNAALEAVIEGEIENEKGKIIAFAKNFQKKP